MLLRDSRVSPADQLLLADLSHPFMPVDFTKLPHETQSQGNLSIHDVDSTDIDNLDVELLLANLQYVIAVLDDVDSAVKLAGVPFVPVDGFRSESVDDFQKNSAVSEVVHQIVHEHIIESHRVYPVFVNLLLPGLVGLGLWFGFRLRFDHLLLFLLQTMLLVENGSAQKKVQPWVSAFNVLALGCSLNFFLFTHINDLFGSVLRVLVPKLLIKMF
jgi:hypothetical protein